jgi:outer membrane lipoprotein LolB
MRIRFWGAALAALLLAGCVTVRQPPVHTPRAGQLSFVLDGRIAVKYDSRHSSGDVHWLHDGDSDDLTMLAPLGITVAHVWRDASGAHLETLGGKYAAENSADLMQRTLGWHLPLDGMPYWVRAQPMPGTPASVERDTNGQVSLLQQDGWDIHYTAYTSASADGMPRRMIMQHDRLEIRLLIDTWKSN